MFGPVQTNGGQVIPFIVPVDIIHKIVCIFIVKGGYFQIGGFPEKDRPEGVRNCLNFCAESWRGICGFSREGTKIQIETEN